MLNLRLWRQLFLIKRLSINLFQTTLRRTLNFRFLQQIDCRIIRLNRNVECYLIHLILKSIKRTLDQFNDLFQSSKSNYINTFNIESCWQSTFCTKFCDHISNLWLWTRSSLIEHLFVIEFQVTFIELSIFIKNETFRFNRDVEFNMIHLTLKKIDRMKFIVYSFTVFRI